MTLLIRDTRSRSTWAGRGCDVDVGVVVSKSGTRTSVTRPRPVTAGSGPDEARAQAISTFQKRFGLEVTGEADDATQQKLRQLHDGE